MSDLFKTFMDDVTEQPTFGPQPNPFLEPGSSTVGGVLNPPAGPAPLDIVSYTPETGNQITSGGEPAGPDLSNPVKKTDYALSKGFGSWEEYQNSLQNNYNSDAAAIDNVYTPIMDVLNQAEAGVRADYPSILAEAQAAFDLNKGTLDLSKEQGLQQLGESDIQAEQRRQTGENKARRLYNELLRSGVQRFGGATSAGEGYRNLLGVEQQRGSAERYSQYSTAKREIETQRYNLNQEYNQTLLKLQQDHQVAKNQARREFDAKIAQINNQRASAESEKRAMKLQALQTMRAQINEINFAMMESQMAVQQQAQLAAQQIEASNAQIDSMLQSAGQAPGAIGTNPESTLYLDQPMPGLEPLGTLTGSKTNDEEDPFFAARNLLGTN